MQKREREWREQLTRPEDDVLRRNGTQPPSIGRYLREKRRRTYRCAGSGTALFSAVTRSASGTGWLSFTEPADRAIVELHDDFSWGMHRIEVTCAVCGGHLGYVFGDGPGETGQASLHQLGLAHLEER